MVFAHLGNGIIAGTNRFLQTTFLLFNDTNQFATGTIELYDDNGDPLELTLGDVTATSFPFSLKSGEIKRFFDDRRGGGDHRVGPRSFRSADFGDRQLRNQRRFRDGLHRCRCRSVGSGV